MGFITSCSSRVNPVTVEINFTCGVLNALCLSARQHLLWVITHTHIYILFYLPSCSRSDLAERRVAPAEAAALPPSSTLHGAVEAERRQLQGPGAIHLSLWTLRLHHFSVGGCQK